MSKAGSDLRDRESGIHIDGLSFLGFVRLLTGGKKRKGDRMVDRIGWSIGLLFNVGKATIYLITIRN